MRWSFVYAWIVVMNPCSIPNVSCRTFAIGATQFVVQEALEMIWCASLSYVVVVDADDDRHVGIGRGRGDDDLRRSGIEVELRLSRLVKKPVDSSTTSTPSSPQEGLRVALGEHLELLAGGGDRPSPACDPALERAEHGVVLEQVRHRSASPGR